MMKTRVLVLVLVLEKWTRGAGFTEPPITFYGTVTNTRDGYSLLATAGQLAWTIQPTSGASFVLSTPLSVLAGGYSYRLQIPVEKVPSGFTLSVATIPTTTGSATYNRTPITLDGAPVSIVSPAGPAFTFAENQRGKMERVDLSVSAPFADADGDGMPDWWETLYGFDPLDPNDALGDADGDGSSNGAEYVAGTNPLNPNERLHHPRGQARRTGHHLDERARPEVPC